MSEPVELDPVDILGHLAGTRLFGNLAPDELARLAPAFSAVRCRPGEMVASQGSVDDHLWVLVEGTVSLDRRNALGVVQFLDYRGYGTVLGEHGVFIGAPRANNVVAVDQAVLLRAAGADLVRRFQADPDLFEGLVLDDVVRDRLEVGGPDAAVPGAREVRVAVYRRHWIALLRGLAVPLGLAGGTLALGALFLAGLSRWTEVGMPVVLLVVVVALFFPLPVAIRAFLSHAHCYLEVTTRRVALVQEGFLGDVRRSEVALCDIRDVEVTVPSVLGRLLGYGTVTVQSAGAGRVMRFDRVADPEGIADTLMDQCDEARQRERAGEDMRIRETARQASRPSSEDRGARGGALAARLHGLVLRPLGRVLAYLLPKTEYHEGSVITWRKHWFLLVRRTALLLLASLLAGTATLAAVAIGSVAGVLVAGFAAAFLVFLTWWNYADWRNDLYQLTDDRLVDIEQRPWGLNREDHEASLDRIQDVRYRKLGLMAWLLDYGDVRIETAGEQGGLTFDGVSSPARVQATIRARAQQYRAQVQAEGHAALSEVLAEVVRAAQGRSPAGRPAEPPSPSSPPAGSPME